LRKELLKTNSFNVMLDLVDGSAPGLVTTRQTKEAFAAFAVKGFCGHKLTSSYDRGYVFPLFSRGEGFLEASRESCVDGGLRNRFRQLIEYRLSGGTEDDLDREIFSYVLAVLNAPSYSEQFGQRLKRDWPRVPLPGSADFLMIMARLGDKLASIQLMESLVLQRPDATYDGPASPEVTCVGWSDETVWLDAISARKGRPTEPGTVGFRGVGEAVWAFHIGGYRVCEKWLKDRKGRTLSDDDIAHYQRIVDAISETIRLMGEIDEVIEEHGGWPGAFVASEAAA
jgi:hypothetical protein